LRLKGDLSIVAGWGMTSRARAVSPRKTCWRIR
jgi:hypothetical protein